MKVKDQNEKKEDNHSAESEVDQSEVRYKG